MPKAEPFIVILPARYASQRLAAKVLADVHGKPLIVRTVENARLSNAERVIVATDDVRISRALEEHAVDFVMTDVALASGTDRIAQAAERLGLAADCIVVNVQGDEPAMPPEVINQLAERVSTDGNVQMVTAATPIDEASEFHNPNAVKVVLDKMDNALYFSRSPIPHLRDNAQQVPVNALRHLGIYAYRSEFGRQYAALTESPLEQIEKLEQLRVLYHGYRIGVNVLAEATPAGIDTEADLIAYRQWFKNRD